MKIIMISTLAMTLGATSAMATGHGPAAGNGQGEGKGRESVAFETSKSKRTSGSTAKQSASELTKAIRSGKDGGFVKEED